MLPPGQGPRRHAAWGQQVTPESGVVLPPGRMSTAMLLPSTAERTMLPRGMTQWGQVDGQM